MRARRSGLVVLAMACCAATPTREAFAQSGQRLAPVGGRTTLVGGTGLVYGRDSASAFLNPATTLRIDKNRLSFSVDFYYLSMTRSSAWYQPGTIDRSRFGDLGVDGDTAVSAFDFDSLPGSLCLFIGAADIPLFARTSTAKELRERGARLGFCLASIQYSAFTYNAEDYEQRRGTTITRQAHNLRQTFRKLAVGPTYSMYVDDRISVGASVHVSRSSHRSMIGATASTDRGVGDGPISSILYNVARAASHELTATVGMLYRISERQTVALAVQSPSLHLFGSGGLNHHTSFRGGGAGSEESTFTADGSFVARSPARVSLGTGLERPWGSVEVNVALHLPMSRAYSAELKGRALEVTDDGRAREQPRSATLSTRALGAVNFGVGGEVFTSPGLSLLGGFGTDISIVPKGTLPNDPLNYYPSRMHRLALSFGVGSHGQGGDLLIGVEGSYGWGERLTPNMYRLPPRLDIADQQQLGLLFVLAGSTSFRSIKRTVDTIKKAVEPEPAKKEPERRDATEPTK